MFSRAPGGKLTTLNIKPQEETSHCLENVYELPSFPPDVGRRSWIVCWRWLNLFGVSIERIGFVGMFVRLGYRFLIGALSESECVKGEVCVVRQKESEEATDKESLRVRVRVLRCVCACALSACVYLLWWWQSCRFGQGGCVTLCVVGVSWALSSQSFTHTHWGKRDNKNSGETCNSFLSLSFCILLHKWHFHVVICDCNVRCMLAVVCCCIYFVFGRVHYIQF